MTSTFTVSCLVLLVLATSLLMAAFMTSHWLRIGRLNRQQLCGCGQCDCGLWYACREGHTGARSAWADPLGHPPSAGCHWFLSPGFSAAAVPAWFKATQVMMAVAALVSVTSVVTGLCSLRASYSLHGVVTVTTVCTAVLVTVSVSVFGGTVSQQKEAAILMEGYDPYLPHLAWSYWLAVAAAVLTWASAVGFFLLHRLHGSGYDV